MFCKLQSFHKSYPALVFMDATGIWKTWNFEFKDWLTISANLFKCVIAWYCNISIKITNDGFTYCGQGMNILLVYLSPLL